MSSQGCNDAIVSEADKMQNTEFFTVTEEQQILTGFCKTGEPHRTKGSQSRDNLKLREEDSMFARNVFVTSEHLSMRTTLNKNVLTELSPSMSTNTQKPRDFGDLRSIGSV